MLFVHLFPSAKADGNECSESQNNWAKAPMLFVHLYPSAKADGNECGIPYPSAKADGNECADDNK